MKPRCDASSSTAGEARWPAKAPRAEVRLSSRLKFLRSAGGRGESKLYFCSPQQTKRVWWEHCFPSKCGRGGEPRLMPRREEDRPFEWGAFLCFCVDPNG